MSERKRGKGVAQGARSDAPSVLRYVICCFIAHCMLPIAFSHAWETKETIRIAIFKGAAATLGGNGISITSVTGNGKVPILSDAELEVKAGRDGLLVNGTSYSSLIAEAKGSRIKVKGRSYRGRIEVFKDNSSLLILNELHLEDYIVGLINQEISSKWSKEAVKAQAVVARTYALFQKRARKDPRYDLESTVISQVYSGSDSEDELALQAVKETEGEVALFKGELIRALYHSACGGKTETAEEMWGKDLPYLRSIKDPYCTEAPNYFWQYQIDAEELGERLRSHDDSVGIIKDINILKKSKSGRVAAVSVRHSKGICEISGKDFREAVGFDNIRSTDFTVKSKKDLFYFAGSGGGHGVGMCQWGAKGMAEDGMSYKEILKHYYPGIEIRRH